MALKFSQQYLEKDDDDRIEWLATITENLDENDSQFLLNQLVNYNDEDEFVMIEIIKVLALYSPVKLHEKIIKQFFNIIQKSDDELLQSHALQSLEHLNLSDKDYQKIVKIKNTSDNEDLHATAEMILLRKNAP